MHVGERKLAVRAPGTPDAHTEMMDGNNQSWLNYEGIRYFQFPFLWISYAHPNNKLSLSVFQLKSYPVPLFLLSCVFLIPCSKGALRFFTETSSKLVLWPTTELNNSSYTARRAHVSGAQCFICGSNFWRSSIASPLFSSAEMHSNNCFHCSRLLQILNIVAICSGSDS
jgi:hypothetical protein